MKEFNLYFLDVLKNSYCKFTGRARRSEYWFYTLFCLIINVILLLIYEPLQYVFSLAIFLPSLGLCVRRLHDINKSGWWYLLAFIPLVGAIIIIIWFCKEGTHGPNQYGEDPKA